MNRVLLLSGSPKYKNSGSEYYLDILYEELDKNYYIEEEKMLYFNDTLKKKVNDADIIVLSTPLYADALPSHVLAFLMKMGDLDLSNKILYVMVNCGFLEGIHNVVALRIIKNYCEAHGIKYMGGLGIGGGPVGYKKIFYNYPIYKQIKNLGSAINYQKPFENNYVSPLIPRFLYINIANYRWKREINTLKK